MATKTPRISDTIRKLIQECGLTRYELSKRSGVEQAALSRFMSGERGLNTESLDRLAAVLGWVIVAGRKVSSPKKVKKEVSRSTK